MTETKSEIETLAEAAYEAALAVDETWPASRILDGLTDEERKAFHKACNERNRTVSALYRFVHERKGKLT